MSKVGAPRRAELLGAQKPLFLDIELTSWPRRQQASGLIFMCPNQHMYRPFCGVGIGLRQTKAGSLVGYRVLRPQGTGQGGIVLALVV